MGQVPRSLLGNWHPQFLHIQTATQIMWSMPLAQEASYLAALVGSIYVVTRRLNNIDEARAKKKQNQTASQLTSTSQSQLLISQSLRAHFLATMRVEEVDKLIVEDLRNKANKVFAKSDTEAAGNAYKSLYYAEARFYVDEIKRREDEAVGRCDFRIELIVIFLIGLELGRCHTSKANDTTTPH